MSHTCILVGKHFESVDVFVGTMMDLVDLGQIMPSD